MKVGVSLGVLLKVMGPGGESWGATGGIWVLEALELTTQHRNGSYLLRGVGVEGYPCREVKGRPGVRLTTENRKGVTR